MSTVSDHLNGLPIIDLPPAEGVRLGAERPRGHPKAPPSHLPRRHLPRLPRKGRSNRTAATALSQVALRYKVIGGGVLVVAATIGFTRLFVHPVDEQAIADAAANGAVRATQQQLAAAKAEATQVAVPTPFSWAKCPMTNEAMGLIGGDPATGGKTLSPERAAPLEQEAQTLLVAFRLPDLRLVSPAPGALKVVATGASGVALFNCLSGNDPTATTPTSVAQ